MSILYKGPSKDVFYQISIHLAKRFQRWRFFRNKPIRNKNGLWQLCLSMNQDNMSNLYRGPSIDVSYQVTVHLAKQFQRSRFLKIGQSETRIPLWWPCLLMDRYKCAFFREDLPWMLPIKFQFIRPHSFRGRFLEIDQSETRIACDGHVC
jgi:hypothetical protein